MFNKGETIIGKHLFKWGERTFIMGIINLSPDSFSGDGCSNIDVAIKRAIQLEQDGADIIDVGGESTRPDAVPVRVDEEIKRVIPFIEKAVGLLSVPISIDTYKVEVARLAVQSGALIINDVSGLRVEPDLVKVAAENGSIMVLTSNERGNPVDDIMPSIIASLKSQIQIAMDNGVKESNIIIDPGIGFGKTVEQNLEIIYRLDELNVLQRPILLGPSRKSFIGKILDLPVQDRLEGTAATVSIGISKGVDIVRVHDVREIKRVCKMSDAICRGRFRN